jgi:CrcB protein
VTVLLVAAGAAVGAPLRYLTDRWVQARFGTVFPFGTLLVNVFGSFVLGALTGLAAGRPMMALLGTGFCGALTTYSTFGYETVRLLAGRATLYAVLNVLVSVTAGLIAATGGMLLGASV